MEVQRASRWKHKSPSSHFDRDANLLGAPWVGHRTAVGLSFVAFRKRNDHEATSWDVVQGRWWKFWNPLLSRKDCVQKVATGRRKRLRVPEKDPGM